MDEGARLDVTLRVDVQIPSPAGDAALHIFPVVPEIQREQRLCRAEIADLMVHKFALPSGHHEVRHGVLPNRHVREEPRKFCTLIDQIIDEFLATDHLGVVARIAQGGAEDQFFSLEDLHGPVVIPAQDRESHVRQSTVGGILDNHVDQNACVRDGEKYFRRDSRLIRDLFNRNSSFILAVRNAGYQHGFHDFILLNHPSANIFRKWSLCILMVFG